MDMVPWHPFRNMERMRRSIDRAFAEPFGSWGALPETWRMRFPVEVLERENEIVVRAELAGIDPSDVDLRITDRGISLRGERKQENDREQEGVRHTERFYGSFARTVAFPHPVDSAQARASFRNGLLEISAPKRQANDGRDGRKLEIEMG